MGFTVGTGLDVGIKVGGRHASPAHGVAAGDGEGTGWQAETSTMLTIIAMNKLRCKVFMFMRLKQEGLE